MNIRKTLIASALTLLIGGVAVVHAQGPGKLDGAKGPQRGMQAADSNNDGRITRAEFDAASAKRFSAMDVNNDGVLDAADRTLRMQQRKAERFAGLDENGDGRISRAEFQAVHAERMAEHMQRRAQRAGSGQPARQMSSAEQRTQRMQAMFDAMDANKDGTITRAEFDAAKPGMHGKRGAGKPGSMPQGQPQR